VNGSGPIFRRRERALLTAGETAMAACKAAIDKWLEPQENDGDGGSVAPNAGPFFLNPDPVPRPEPREKEKKGGRAITPPSKEP